MTAISRLVPSIALPVVQPAGLALFVMIALPLTPPMAIATHALGGSGFGPIHSTQSPKMQINRPNAVIPF